MALPPELAKELDGIDLGFHLFFDETSILLGLLAGAGERSHAVKGAGNELVKVITFTRAQAGAGASAPRWRSSPARPRSRARRLISAGGSPRPDGAGREGHGGPPTTSRTA